jgi:two-component system NtrC family sensor kinase
MTVSRRILLHVVIGASIVILVVSAVTYGYVQRTAEIRTLEHLRTYATERARHQQAELARIHGNMETVRSLYLKRLESVAPDEAAKRWQERVIPYPDGAWRSHLDFADPLVNATVWAGKEMDRSPESIRRLITAQFVLEDLMPTWTKRFPSVYLMFPGAACVGFNPLQPTWEWDTPADYPLEVQEWYAAASPARNPSRGLVWTGVYADPISHISYASVLLPVEADGVHYCTIGHDVTLEKLLDEWTRSSLPHALHMIFEPDGDLIAHPAVEGADSRERRVH